MAWKTAVKQAGRDYREGKISGSKGARKSAGKSSKKKVSGTKARVGTKPKYKVIHEVRRINGVSYRGGSVSIRGTEDVNRQKGKLQALLGEQLGWLDVAIASATTKGDKNKLMKARREKLAELKKVSK
jgi:hypothetical protein